MEDLEKTISPETTPIPALSVVESEPALASSPAESFVPPSRKAFPAAAAIAQPVSGQETPNLEAVPAIPAIQDRLDVAPAATRRSGVERTMTRLFLLVLVMGALAAAFYAGEDTKAPFPISINSGSGAKLRRRRSRAMIRC